MRSPRQTRRASLSVELLEDRRNPGGLEVPMITEYDVATGATVTFPAPGDDLGVNLHGTGGFGGNLDLLSAGGPPGATDDPASAGDPPPTVHGTDDRVRITSVTSDPYAKIDVPDKSLFCCNLFNFMDLRHLICLISLPCAIIT